MDLWLVAVIAAGGYVAKHWQNPLKNNDSFSRLSSGDPGLEKLEPPSCPSSRLAWRKRSGKACSADRRDSKEEVSDLNPKNFEWHEDCNVLTISNLSSSLISDSNLMELGDVNPQISDIDDGNYSVAMCPDASAGPVGHVYCSTKRKNPLRTKFSGAQVVRPLGSLESCLVAQLPNGHSELEGYVFSSFTSPITPVVRPLLVRDGSRIISKVNDNSFFPLVRKEETYLQKKRYPKKTDHVIGIHPLPEIESLRSSKKKATETGKGWNERPISSDIFSGKHLAAQHGLSNGRLLFFLGISIGAMSSITVNKREIDRLNDLLKHSENLVDDLHEELQMNDSIIVKELASENHELHDTCENYSNDNELNASPEQQMDNLAKFNLKEQYKPKADAKSDSLSRIEAELEAELERLELNMESYTMDRRIPTELDPYLFTDFARGDLRAKIQEGRDEGPPKLYDNEVDTFRNQTGNYAVSPRELSLRLHEVIESRLEERIKELEVALENSQRKIQLLESGQKKHCRSNFSDYDLGSPPSREIQIVDSTPHPFVMDLSGEALDAYHEAYEEMIKMDESEDDSPSGFNNTDMGVNSCEWCTNGVRNEVKHMTFSPLNSQKNSSELSSENLMPKGRTTVVSEMNFVDLGDNSDSSDDVMERYLIKEIVERTRRGSPVVLNAEKILYSMDEDDH